MPRWYSSPGRAVRSLVRLARNLAMDLRYGGFAGGWVQQRYSGATGVANTDYRLLDQIFPGEITDGDVLVDVGCGKGRVLNWWLHHHPRNEIFGLEIMEDIAARTGRRLRSFPNVHVISGDAIANLPENGTVFFLANPFEAPLLARFKERVAAIFGGRAGRKILYFAPIHLWVFAEDASWDVRVRSLSDPGAGRFEERHRNVAVIRQNSAPVSSP